VAFKREKQPFEVKEYQFSLRDYLAIGEDVESFFFRVEEKRQQFMEEFIGDFTSISVVTTLADGTAKTYVYPVLGFKGFRLMGLLEGLGKDVTDTMIVPGTVLWDSNTKIAKALVRGGENGKDYVITFRFVTTMGRSEEREIELSVREL
jgi:hypothetical protein